MITQASLDPSREEPEPTALLSLNYSFCPRGIEMSKGKREASPEKEIQFGIKVYSTGCL